MRRPTPFYLGLALPLLLIACGSPGPAPKPASFALSLTPAETSQVIGAPESVTLKIVPEGGFKDTVSVAVAADTGVTVTPSSASLAPDGSQAFTVVANQAGTFNVTFTGTSGTLTSNATLKVTAALSKGIAGTLTDGVGGAALGGAKVQLLLNGVQLTQITTDANGFYQFGNLAAGSYTLLAPGQTLQAPLYQGGAGAVPYAASQVIGVGVSGLDVLRQNLIQIRAVASTLSTVPPSLDVASPADGAVVSGSDSAYPVTLTSTAQGGNAINAVTAAIDHDPYLFALARYNRTLLFLGGAYGQDTGGPTTTTGPLTAKLNLARLAAGLNGAASLQLVSIDSNHNRTLRLIPLTVQSSTAGTALTAPVADVSATAITVQNTRLSVQSLRSQAAPQNTTLWAEVDWTPSAFPVQPSADQPDIGSGYKIYRSLAGGPQQLVAVLPVYFNKAASPKPAVANPGTWNDAGADLAPGVPVTYSVVAFSGDQNSPPSAPASTTPLPQFVVKLGAPQDQASGVSTTPAFSWTTNGVGAAEYFVPVLGDTIAGGIAFCGVPASPDATGLEAYLQSGTQNTGRGFGVGAPCGVVGGKTASSYGFTYAPDNQNLPPLQTARPYQWQLYEAVAVNDPASPSAISVATDGGTLYWPYGSGLNTFEGDEVFTFITGGK